MCNCYEDEYGERIWCSRCMRFYQAFDSENTTEYTKRNAYLSFNTDFKFVVYTFRDDSDTIELTSFRETELNRAIEFAQNFCSNLPVFFNLDDHLKQDFDEYVIYRKKLSYRGENG